MHRSSRRASTPKSPSSRRSEVDAPWARPLGAEWDCTRRPAHDPHFRLPTSTNPTLGSDGWVSQQLCDANVSSSTWRTSTRLRSVSPSYISIRRRERRCSSRVSPTLGGCQLNSTIVRRNWIHLPNFAANVAIRPGGMPALESSESRMMPIQGFLSPAARGHVGRTTCSMGASADSNWGSSPIGRRPHPRSRHSTSDEKPPPTRPHSRYG